MHQLLFLLKQLLMLPFTLVVNIKEILTSQDERSARGRSLLLGLPALFLAFTGVFLLVWANYGMGNQLESRYVAKWEKTNREVQASWEKVRKKEQEVALLQVKATGKLPEKRGKFYLPDDDPDLTEFQELQKVEDIYLLKLIDLDPNNMEYRYQYAMAAFRRRMNGQAISLLKALAPEDKPGHAGAHLQLAKYYSEPLSRGQGNASLALKHAEHCLTRDKDNREAKMLKANLLTRDGKYEAAYQVYNELFQAGEVDVYRTMYEINRKLEREGRNQEILLAALGKYELRLKELSLKPSSLKELSLTERQVRLVQWRRYWQQRLLIYRLLERYADAERLLRQEIAGLQQDDDALGKTDFLKIQLAQHYLLWRESLRSQNGGKMTEKQLDCLKKAAELFPRNDGLLAQLADVVIMGEPEWSKKAREVYDPFSDPDAPATVLNLLGANSLATHRYEDAIAFFEKAFKKNNNDAQTLNNLAWAYLMVGEGTTDGGSQRNPKRALQLVNRAFYILNRNPRVRANREIVSGMQDTRGTALMHLKQWSKAINAFENALQYRPNDQRILESLIKCYEGAGFSTDADIYRERLKALEQKTKENPPASDTPSAGPPKN